MRREPQSLPAGVGRTARAEFDLGVRIGERLMGRRNLCDGPSAGQDRSSRRSPWSRVSEMKVTIPVYTRYVYTAGRLTLYHSNLA